MDYEGLYTVKKLLRGCLSYHVTPILLSFFTNYDRVNQYVILLLTMTVLSNSSLLHSPTVQSGKKA
jgi:hypothetical protein